MSDCIIIGAGLAALTAASRLTRAGLKPVLLEARERIGGRASTATVNNFKVDVGCSMIHGHLGGNPLSLMSEQAGIPVHIPPRAAPFLVGADGPLSADEANALLDSSVKSPKPHTNIPADVSLAEFTLPSLESSSLQALARAAEVGAGVKLEAMSAKWSAFGRPFPGADAFPVNGYAGIVDKLAEEVKAGGGLIETSAEVVAVEDLGAGRGVKVTTRSGESYSAKTALSTIPLGVLQQLDESFFSPALSAPLAAAIERTVVGTLEKCILSYDSAWWPAPDTHGTYILLPTVNDGSAPTSLSALFARTTLPVLNFWQAGLAPHPTLLVYVGASAGAFLESYSKEDVAKAMHAYLLARFGLEPDSVPPPLASHVTDWGSDPFSRGATSAPTTLSKSKDGEQASPLDFFILGRSEWDGRLGFAGEHTDPDVRGSAGGAVVSGEREGRRLVELLSRI